MARFNGKLPMATSRVPAQTSAAAVDPIERVNRSTAEAAGSGPGWFDSSRELVGGLQVTESALGDWAPDEWTHACFAC